MKSIVQRVAIAICALTLAALGLMAGAGSASAVPVGCSSTYLCFYADPSYSGGEGKVSGDNPAFTAFSTSTSNCGNGNWNDCVSSIFNDGSSCTVWVWSANGYTGKSLSIARGVGYSNLKTVSFDDIISSNHWCTAN